MGVMPSQCASGDNITLGAHAQEGYGVCLFVCLSVCLSVCYHLIVDIVRFTKVYVRYSFRLFFIFTAWIFEKAFRSKVMARKSQYANEQLPGFSPFRIPCIHQ